MAGSFDHDTGEIKHIVLKENWDADDHNTCSFLVLSDRRFMVFYARHNKQGLFCRISLEPEDIGQWGDEITVADTPGITYSHPVYLAEEKRFYVFWRGESWKPTFATSGDGITWSPPRILIQDEGRETRDIRPYLKVASDGKSAIHFAFTDGHPRNEPENSVYYLRYERGDFFRADGVRVGAMESLPVPHRRSDLVYDGRATGIRAWVWDIAADANGCPVIAYTRLPAETDHRYHYARWTGESWLDTELTPAGGWFPQTPPDKQESEPHYSGGMALNHANPSRVYLARPVGGIFEIEKWTSSNLGKSWSSQAITARSEKLNVRPVVPQGYSGTDNLVLWMHGEYVHYTNYTTDIRMTEIK
jgi:hypothetical protein